MNGDSTASHGIEPTLPLLAIATREVVHLAADATLIQAAGAMSARSISSVLVEDADGRPQGLLTERDLLAAMRGGMGPDTPVARVMSSPVLGLPGSTPYTEAYRLCLKSGVRHLAVLAADGRTAGIVSETDFRRQLALTTPPSRHPVAAIMRSATLALAPEATLAAALERMHAGGTDAVLVVENERPSGIVTERDLVRLFARGAADGDTPLREVMTAPVAAVPLDTSLHAATERMRRQGFRHLAAVDQAGRLAGVVSEHDLTQALAGELADVHVQAERRLLRTLVDTVPDGIALVDPQSLRFLDVNDGACRMLGWSREELIELGIPGIQAELSDAGVRERVNAVLAAGRAQFETRHRTKDGREIDVDVRAAVLDLPQGRRLVSVWHDVTDRLALERRLAESEERLRTLIDGTPDIICFKDGAGRWLHSNRANLELFGLTGVDYRGRTDLELAELAHPHTRQALGTCFETDERAWAAGGIGRGDEAIPVAEGGVRIFDVIKTPIFENGERRGLVVLGRDITDRRAREAELHRIAFYDILTGVPNRRLLAERMETAIARADAEGTRLAVCYLDLDGFKEVNDAFGHAMGDRLLVEVVARLGALLGPADTLARLGGDELVILLGALPGDGVRLARSDSAAARPTAEGTAEQAAGPIADPGGGAHPGAEDAPCLALAPLLAALARPFTLDGAQISITASLGMTLYPEDDADPDTLLRHADQAMYRAKESGKNRCVRFDPARDREVRARCEALRRLAAALAQGELVLHYQPQVDLATREVVAVEALLRWQHPERGLLAPGELFAPVPGSELEPALGDWALRSALEQIGAWRAAGLALRASVNVGVGHLRQGDFPARLAALLAAVPGASGPDLELELAESAAVGDPREIAGTLAACRALGVRVVLDDFGLGFASLALVRRLPLEGLKIDASFVRDMLSDPQDLEIVASVVRLARGVGRSVVAVGVETPEHGETLRRLGCHLAQGDGIAPPLPPEAIPAWVAAWQAARPAHDPG